MKFILLLDSGPWGFPCTIYA